MRKIAVLPLDERPCNYHFNQWLVRGTDYEVLTPSLDILGDKKQKGNLDAISAWLLDVSKDVDAIVCAVDTLVYGGIVPSRLHHDEVDTLLNRLNLLKTIKAKYPKLTIYAYNLIMRNPKYSSSEEEPDYYETWGREIHLYGVYEHKKTLGILTENEAKQLEDINKRIDQDALKDYLWRRNQNVQVNLEFLKLVKDGTIDFGIVPQDDSSPYGLTATDQKIIREAIKNLDIELSCYMYPGADEVTNVLLMRYINVDQHKRPKLYVEYASITGGQQIPLYEDRLLHETIKYQILAVGGLIVSSISECDLMLLVNTPSSNMKEAPNQHIASLEYDAFRNLIEYVEKANYGIELGKKVIIADVAYANGGDLNLLKLLKQKGILMKVSAYAGWNTSSNTLGTCIPQGMLDFLFPNRQENLDFLGLRYVEDMGYCAVVRKEIASKLVKPNHYFLLDGKRGAVVHDIKVALEHFIDTYLSNTGYQFIIKDIYSPWNRMFETGLDVYIIKNQ
ncbi:DUF4127 family protein [Acholeplasma vituli]|uniref:DUF4127 family protein n=1 Tax=Paracholeplasma vituli TaxID=69473 RepID=A0ABT2PV25_9MOLU|nr:DUF4127 family protein [Paracholeplasma vituli]MCU0104281.1 DUF4127 family protein [Paracholeplasma vituli]